MGTLNTKKEAKCSRSGQVEVANVDIVGYFFAVLSSKTSTFLKKMIAVISSTYRSVCMFYLEEAKIATAVRISI